MYDNPVSDRLVGLQAMRYHILPASNILSATAAMVAQRRCEMSVRIVCLPSMISRGVLRARLVFQGPPDLIGNQCSQPSIDYVALYPPLASGGPHPTCFIAGTETDTVAKQTHQVLPARRPKARNVSPCLSVADELTKLCVRWLRRVGPLDAGVMTRSDSHKSVMIRHDMWPRVPLLIMIARSEAGFGCLWSL